MRIALEKLLRAWNADQIEHIQRKGACLLAGHVPVRANGLHDLPTDGEDGIQRRHRFLKDHGNVVSSKLLHLLARQHHQVATTAIGSTERNLAIDIQPPLMFEEPHQGEANRRFSGTGLADQGDDFTGLHREVHAA